MQVKIIHVPECFGIGPSRLAEREKAAIRTISRR
jgi:hypothetical protein